VVQLLLVASTIPRYTTKDPSLRQPSSLFRALVAITVLVVGGASLPALADTRGELEAARKRLEQAETELRSLTLEWQRTEASLARAQDAEERARRQIARLEDTLIDAQAQLGLRAQEMFMAGPSPTVAALLTSGSVGEVADRWEFASSVAQGDQDLATRVTVQTELLRRERADLARAVKRKTQAVAALERQKGDIESRISQLEGLEADLERKIAAQQAAALAASAGEGDPGSVVSPGPIGSGAIQTCPVAGANSFVDSFGWPRPGGRVHEGIDLIAAAGTPVVATHSGDARQTSSSLGGNGVVLYHDGSADWTFYTHFSSFGASGHVSTGTVIGYVGSTGVTSVNHLHFEYHPGGGGAVNPYSMLLAVC
jgi:murein DD-endopeptidase MepM/ murein hydrolase activator NlpD